jgi:GTPase SAR1 family protein
LEFWLSDLNKHAPEKIVKIMIGNKCDLTNVGNAHSGDIFTHRSSIDNRREVPNHIA